jgi:hypothetical protein
MDLNSIICIAKRLSLQSQNATEGITLFFKLEFFTFNLKRLYAFALCDLPRHAIQ